MSIQGMLQIRHFQTKVSQFKKKKKKKFNYKNYLLCF